MLANARAVARPTPEPAPVITTTLGGFIPGLAFCGGDAGPV
jgi:hypothetical protein